MMIRKSTIAGLILLLGGTAIACSGPMNLDFVGTQPMNRGNALRVVVFQLTSDAAFSNAPYDSFWSNDNLALAQDLASPKQVLTLFPETEVTREFKPVKGALFVGIAANYAYPDQQGWRVIYAVDQIKGKAITITAGEDRLFAEVR